MERLPTDSAIPPNRRKPKIWDRMKRRNSSSPSFQRLETRNWSSRSLPRFGSFGSASVIDGNTVTPKSAPISDPVVEQVSILEQVLRNEPEVEKDHFCGLPNEVKLHIFSLLPVKTLARASAVCKQWQSLCNDGALYSSIDTRTFYKNIASPVLMSMLLSAGPFLRHLNLRGCAQLRSTDIFALATRATNLVSLSLEGCPILDSMCLEVLLSRNPSLRTLDLSGLKGMTDKVATEIATHCTALERLDLGWCSNMTCSGLYDIVSFCKRLKRLRICDNPAFAGPFIRKLLMALHYLDKLEVLVLSGCRDLVDNSLRILFRGSQALAGADEPVRILPLRQLNLSRIVNLTDTTLRNLAGVVPHLQKLELAGSSNGTAFTNAGFAALLPTIPKLTHLDLEDNHHITDATLHLLASLPIADSLVHLQLSYCLEITDAGIIRILQHCIHLRNLEVDNTQAGDGMLMEAPRLIARRAASSSAPRGLRIVAYDCGAISWVGVSEILAQNLHFARTHNICRRDSNVSDFHKNYYSSPVPIIRMKCTFEWQKLVDAHTRRCLRGEYAAAEQIALGFSRWMMEEAEEGAWGGNARRRRRRAMGFAEHGEDAFVMGVGRRRLRAFSAPSSCLVM